MPQPKIPQVACEYLTIPAVARVLDISERTAWELVHADDDPIPSYTIGRKIRRVRHSDLHEWMARRRSDSTKVDRIVDEVLGGMTKARQIRPEVGR